MGRNRIVECRICLKTMTSDHLKRHMKRHEKKMNVIDEAGSFMSVISGKVGKHKQVECKICLKTMRGDNLKRHMRRHEKKPYSIDESQTYTSGEMKNVDETETKTSLVKYTGLNLEMLEKNVESYVDEFNRKIELGRNLKIIINKQGFNINALP